MEILEGEEAINRAKELLAKKQYFLPDAIIFQMKGDVLIVAGVVPSYYMKQLVIQAVSQVGCKFGIDKLIVGPS